MNIRSLAVVLVLTSVADGAELRDPRSAGGGIVVGLEYALLNTERATILKAPVWAELGLTGMKPLGEVVAWGKMQPSADEAIDFERLDWFVREYQRNGFTELTIPLKSHSRWASKDVRLLKSTNATPKERFVPLYEHWIEAVVERYDHDGVEDMPGLRWPVRHYEIGTELSSYEPEPVDQYLDMLAVAYRAAHRAFPGVRIAHVAFLTTPVDFDVASPKHYDRVWRVTKRFDTHHGLADIRAILDRPDLFDTLNLHNLGDPYEIEHQIRWLEWETNRRGYSKPVMISDTVPTSYIAWGQATNCHSRVRGLLIPPAKESDRCRLASFFSKLIDKDPATLAWTRGFVAADHVQRTIIAAEQGVELINLSFVSDLPLLTGKLARAGAGISGWGGAVRQNPRTGAVHEKYPLYFALRQLMGHLEGYRSVDRLVFDDPQARLYELETDQSVWWVGWRDPGKVLLPGDEVSTLDISLDVGVDAVELEPVITGMGQQHSQRTEVKATHGKIELGLEHTPVYVFPSSHKSDRPTSAGRSR